MLLASLLVGTVLLFSSRKSGLYTVGKRERVQSGTIGTRVERAQLSRAANSQSKCVLAAGGGCAPRAQESKRAEGRERESIWRERCTFSRFLKWTLGWHFSGTQRFFLVPLSRSLPLPPSRSLLLALYLLSLLNFHLVQVETCLKKKTRNSTHYPKMPGDGTRTRRRTMHYLANDLCCWIAKYLLVPFH